MTFSDVLEFVKRVVKLPYYRDYDGIIVKRLESSNTLDDGRSTNQTHIAITGAQMDIFPYLAAEGYFNCNYEEKDDGLKKYIFLKLPINIFRDNVSSLADDNSINIFSGIFEESLKTYVSLVRSRRKDASDQIQMSLTQYDSTKFIEFRKCLHQGDYIIILKVKNEIEYDCFGISKCNLGENSEELKRINNSFYKLPTMTSMECDKYISMDSIKNNTIERVKFGINRLFYGVPGVGKSYTVKQETKGYSTERVVFHPDYTYADFVGQILPKHNEEENRLEYKFTPGPFTKILKLAENNPGMKCCLIIEELNRGNAPAIFGELFQLLDRSEDEDNFGESVYGVTNHDIAKEVYGDENHEVKIPSNLSIYATMNTSDQNVFTLDTAFQRRWFMTYIPNKFDKAHAADIIKDTEINWGAFATVVNECLHNDNTFMSTEDKSLGVFFATAVDTSSKERFAEKVLKYLWDDAFKLDRTPLFKDNIKSFGQLMMYYYDAEGDALEAVIKHEVYADMKNRCAKYADITQ